MVQHTGTISYASTWGDQFATESFTFYLEFVTIISRAAQVTVQTQNE